MFRLGLTGSIATGKSFVLECLAELGLPVYSADKAVHELYEGEAVAPVEALFPGVTHDGVIDRAVLSARLLADPEGLARLEAVVHPLVRKKMGVFLEQAGTSGAEIAVLEIPLLFESGERYPVDAVAVTTCSPAEQRARALRRPGMSVEKLDAMLARQLPQEEKRARADFVIDTGGSYDETRAEVRAIVARIRNQIEKERT